MKRTIRSPHTVNQLASLLLNENINLVKLYCEYNHLTALDLSKNTELEYLNCSNNQLTVLDLSKNSALRNKDLFHCKITENFA